MADQQPHQLKNLTPVGAVNQNPGTVKPRRLSKAQKLARELNRNRDLNTAHDFDFIALKDTDITDDSAFNGIWAKIAENRKTYNNFSGDPAIDFTNLTPAEIQYFSDYCSEFLGINFKKIGHALGSAATDVGHAVRGGAVAVAHVSRDFGTVVGHGARAAGLAVAHVGRDIGQDVGKVAGKGATAVGHVSRDIAVDVAHGTRAVGLATAHGARAAGKAVAPYWKVIGTAALVAVLAATGVGLPIALSIGAAALTGLDAIQPAQPELPAGFGAGATMGGSDGGGFPSVGGDDPQTDDDTAQSDAPTPHDEQEAQAQADEETAQAEADAKAHTKKLMLWGGAIVAIIVAVYLLKRK
ncbi:MAG: hypothetical protein ACXVJE_19540 [Mucilaginibacter sp.]